MSLAKLSDRGTGLITLREVFTSVDGVIDTALDATALGLGDVMLYSVSFRGSGIATLVADPEQIAVRWNIVEPGGVDSYEIARSRLFPVRTNSVAATEQLRMPVFWRTATERLNVEVQEIDTNATPTMTVTVEALVRRLTELRRSRRGTRRGPVFTVDP